MAEMDDLIDEYLGTALSPADLRDLAMLQVQNASVQDDAVQRAVESMEAALLALEQGRTPDIILTETETAMQALGELTGSSIRDDITDRIFSRFCVGK